MYPKADQLDGRKKEGLTKKRSQLLKMKSFDQNVADN